VGASAEQTAEFAIKLDDETSGAAESAASGLQRLREQIQGDTKAIGQMQRALKNLQGATVVNVQQVKQLKDGIAAKKAAVAQAQGAYIDLGGTFTETAAKGNGLGSKIDALAKQVKKSSEAAAATEGTNKYGESLETLAKHANALPGPLGGFVSKLQAIRKTIGADAVLSLTVGFVGLAAAIGVATAALTKYGIAEADAYRSERLHLEGLTKIRSWYGFAAGNAKEMQQQIDRVSASSALSREKIAGYSEQLYRMGLRGNNLASALEGVAIKASVQGEAQANMFAHWAAGINLTGGSVDKFTDKVKNRLGGIAQKQMQSLTVQAIKQRESFNALFHGLNVDGFLKAQKEVKDLLSQNTASGRALKQIMTLVLQPFINSATAAQPLIKRFFQGMIIQGQRLVIGFLLVRNQFRKTFGGGDDVVRPIDKMNAALVTGRVVLYSIAAALAFAAGALLVWAGPALLAGAAIYSLINTAKLLKQLWDEIDWKLLGQAIWRGIVDGLKAGVSMVTSAAKGIAAAATKTFKSALGISSPSKVFMRMGTEIPAGVAAGVRQGTPTAQASVDNVVRTPDVAAPRFQPEAMAAAPAAGSGGANNTTNNSKSVTINELHVHTTAEKPRDVALDFKRQLESVLEGVVIEFGAPLPGGAQ
jgi:hypothetical protein